MVDLGCGGGLDVFLARETVGPTGKAIGIDMTAEMLDLARRNAAKADAGRPLANVEFHQATIDKLPLPDASVDCVISNCVINLAPDKQAVFREIVRVLKPGGRLAVSDIALKKPLPPELGGDLMVYVGCIGRFSGHREGSENDEIKDRRHRGTALFVLATVVTLVLKETPNGEPRTATSGVRPPGSGRSSSPITCTARFGVSPVTTSRRPPGNRESGFADELHSGRIEWRVVNYDDPGNEHFANRLQARRPVRRPGLPA